MMAAPISMPDPTPEEQGLQEQIDRAELRLAELRRRLAAEVNASLEDNLDAMRAVVEELSKLLLWTVRNHARWVPLVSYFRSDERIIDELRLMKARDEEQAQEQHDAGAKLERDGEIRRTMTDS
jgi:hypothetical protein